MPVYTDKRNNRLFIQFRLRGELYKERLPKTTTRKEAEVLEIKIKSQMLFEQHGIAVDRKDQTFERFVKDVYLPYVEANHSPASFERSLNICKAVFPFLKAKQMRAVRPADIERFKTYRTGLPTHCGPRKPATVARELSIISRIFSLAVREDVCLYNPCTRVKKPQFDNVQSAVLRYEDEKAFFDNFDKEKGGWAKEICQVVLHTGLRQNDILGLQKFQVDLRSNVIRLVQGKTKRRVNVPMTPTVRTILERRYALKGLLLFPSPKTGEQAKGIRTAIKAACRRAKIAPLTIRDLRRTCATRLDDYGFSSGTIAKYLGHSDLRSVHRYQRGTEILEKAAEALENGMNDAPGVPIFQMKKRSG